MTQACLPHMKAGGFGRIINTSPPITLNTMGGHTAYNISKFGMTMVALGQASLSPCLAPSILAAALRSLCWVLAHYDYVAPAHLASAVRALCLSFVSVSPLLQVCLKSMGRSLASPPTLCGPLRWSRATHRSTLNWVTRRCGARQQSCQTVYWRLCLKIALSLDIS